MELEGNMASEISQIEKDKYCMISPMWNLKTDKFIDKEIRFVVTRGGE